MPKISQLESATDVTANDFIQIVDVEDTGMAVSGTNKKCSAQLMANELGKLTNITATNTTSARSLIDRASNVFNVRDFGAIGNGVADDRNAFQSAFNAANTAGGGIVYIPKGRYRKSDTANNIWTIYSNTSLVGDGDQSVIFFDDRSTQARSGNDMIQTNPDAETQNIEFKDFKVEGTLLTELTTSNQKQCFTGTRINGLRFENVTMFGLRYMATAFNLVKNGVFNNNRLEYISADGLRTTSSQNVVFSNNNFKSVCDDCIAAHAYNADSPRAGSFVVTGNTIEASQGIKLLGAKEVLISNNVIRRSLRSPIWIETTGSSNIEGQTNLLSIVVTGNTICDSFGNRGVNSAIYFNYQDGRSKQALSQQPGVSTSPYEYNYLASINNGTTVKSGMFGVIISNNIISRTLGNVAEYSSFGYGQLFDRVTSGFWSDPAFNDSTELAHGIVFSNGINGLNISNNVVSGTSFTGILLNNSANSNILDYTNCTVSSNSIIDTKGIGLYVNGSGSGVGGSQISITDNIFDIDPYFKHAGHNSNNTWAATTSTYGMYANFVIGLYLSGNTFKNCANTGLGISSSTLPSGANYIYADFTSGGLNDAGTNLGVRLIPSLRNTVVIPIIGDPTSATYGQIRNTILLSSNTQPSTGYYIQGAFVQKSTATVAGTSPNQYVVTGYWRLTTGNSHVANTDWIETRSLTGT